MDGSSVHMLSEVGSEPGGRRTVNDVVVNGDGEVDDIPHFDPVADRTGLFAESADDHHE